MTAFAYVAAKAGLPPEAVRRRVERVKGIEPSS